MINKIIKADSSKTAIIIRLMIGFVFISEGIQKFILSDIRGVGRFIKLGVFYPEWTSNIVGAIEIAAGILILIGLFTRIASAFLIIIMLFAVYYSQIPVLKEEGFWAMANKIRTDWSMILGNLYLLIQVAS